MLKLNGLPENKEKFARLLKFAGDVLVICQRLGIEPVLSGSLAVFAYTQDEAMSVNDIDLACKECEFARIIESLKDRGIDYKQKEWHVLQVLRGDLKVEFDSLEYWMKDLPEEYAVLDTGTFTIKVVSVEYLQQLYSRGLKATAGKEDEENQKKHAALKLKYEFLNKVNAPVGPAGVKPS